MGVESPKDGHADLPPPEGADSDCQRRLREVAGTALASVRERLLNSAGRSEQITLRISRDEALETAKALDFFVDAILKSEIPPLLGLDLLQAGNSDVAGNVGVLERWKTLNLENLAILLEVSDMITSGQDHPYSDYAAFCKAYQDLQRSLAASFLTH